MDVTEVRSGDGAPAQGVTAARKLKKPKPAPIEVPVPDVPYELSLDGTFRDFKHGFEISRGGVRLAPDEPPLGMMRTASAHDLSLLGGDVTDLWSRPPSVASPSPGSGTPGAHHRRNWSSGSDGDCPGTPARGFDVALRDLRVTGILGRGAGGVVHSVVHGPSGQAFALKVVPLDVRDAVRRRLIAELRCLHASMSCPAIVPLHGAFLCDGSVAIVLELMDRGSLADVLKAFPTGKNGVPEQPLRCIAARVLVGLSYLHDSCHIIHRDLKPSNLLLNSRGEVKISDFGVSGQLRPGQPQSSTWLGTTRYMAPERIAGQQYDTSSDVWALGITLLECATGAHPYQEEPVVLRRDEAPDGRHAPHCAGDTPPDFWALHERITQHPPPQLEPSTRFSAACAEFLDHCLQKEGACRWSAEQLRQHPWVCARAGDLDGHDPAGEAGECCVAAFVATVTGSADAFSMPSDSSSWLGSLPTGVRLRASPSASTLHTVAE